MKKKNLGVHTINLDVLNKALKDADRQALRMTKAKGLPQVKRIRNQIVEISPSGSVRVLEKIKPLKKLHTNLFELK